MLLWVKHNFLIPYRAIKRNPSAIHFNNPYDTYIIGIPRELNTFLKNYVILVNCNLGRNSVFLYFKIEDIEWYMPILPEILKSVKSFGKVLSLHILSSIAEILKSDITAKIRSLIALSESVKSRKGNLLAHSQQHRRNTQVRDYGKNTITNRAIEYFLVVDAKRWYIGLILRGIF